MCFKGEEIRVVDIILMSIILKWPYGPPFALVSPEAASRRGSSPTTLFQSYQTQFIIKENVELYSFMTIACVKLLFIIIAITSSWILCGMISKQKENVFMYSFRTCLTCSIILYCIISIILYFYYIIWYLILYYITILYNIICYLFIILLYYIKN